MDWTSISLFLAYTLVTFLVSVVNRRNTETKGEAVKNEAISTVNGIATDALKDVSKTREELDLVRTELQKEREARAYVEGQVEQISAQATQEKARADKAQIKMTVQDGQITRIYNELKQITDEFDVVKRRLAKVEAERDDLIRDKARLITDLSAKGTAYDNLMASVQDRIDQAVSDVRLELKQHYQEKISKLEAQINAKDEEIAQLKLQLEETSHEKPSQPSTDNPVTAPIPILPPADPSPKRNNAGPTTNNPSQPRSNSGDNTNPTNNPASS